MTLLITHSDCFEHVTPPGHPEQVARLDAVLNALEDLDLTRLDAPLAAEDDLLRVHTRAYLKHLSDNVPEQGFRALDEDTFVSRGSLAAAWRAAGASVRAVDAVLGGEARNVFCATRPPGHHAQTDGAMGFCLFGNVAVAAKHALDHHGLKRVAIVDFDVHHGNGTQDLVAGDDRILFVSSHQVPHWPGTGRESDDNTINIPLAVGSDGPTALKAWQPAFEAIAAHKPGLILVSAGFDAHSGDPKGDLEWQEADYAALTEALCDLADELCAGKLVSVLEGGYDLGTLERSARIHVETLIKRSAP